MSWQRYDLVFQLLAPLHIGYRTVGNLMQTRGYVPSKNQWAALTARLTRDYDNGADGQRYVEIGQQVQDHFRFTYLYPATDNGNEYKIHYPWDDDFDYLFLGSYASSALNYDRQAAEEGLLHETEFIAPCTRDNRPVYLTGSLYVKPELPTPLDKWQDTLDKFQMGAERGYGWGRLRLVNKLKGEMITGEPTGVPTKDGHIIAHLKAGNVTGVTGSIEPVIGWERNNDNGRKSNWKLSQQAIICYSPGARVGGEHNFTIGQDGFWE
jgi:hypothetical protein